LRFAIRLGKFMDHESLATVVYLLHNVYLLFIY